MEFNNALIGLIAGFVSLIGFIPYIISIIRGKTRPNRASWWIWSFIGFLLLASYAASGATDTIWVPISYVIGPFITALLSIKYGEGGWNIFDRSCILVATSSAVLWFIFDSALIALVINLAIDTSGALPTIRKVYLDPDSEDKLSWFLFCTGSGLNLLAINEWSFVIASYPLYLFIGSSVITSLIFFKRRKK